MNNSLQFRSAKHSLNKQHPRIISLKAKLTCAILLTVSTTVALVYVPWFLTSKKNIDSVVRQLNEESIRSTTHAVRHIFTNVLSTKQLIHRTLSQNLISLDNPEQVENFYLALLEANPSFTWVQFGFPNGDFLGAQRYKPDALRIVNRFWNAEQQNSTRIIDTYQLTPQGVKFQEQEVSQEQYFAPERPWYKVAVANPNRDSWSEVYVYATTKTPGIDSTVTLYQDDQLLGVIGIGFELRQISEYLQSLPVSTKGTVFIINSKSELIAFTDPKELTNLDQDAKTAKLKKLSESNNKYLQIACRSLEDHKLPVNEIYNLYELIYRDPVSGEKYYISFKEMHYLDWVVGTVIPESIFLEDINRNQKFLFIVVSSLVVTTVSLAILLSDRVLVKPIRTLTQAAQVVEQGHYDQAIVTVNTHDEVAVLAHTFNQMVSSLKERERERDIFGRVVSPEVREQLLRGQLQLGGQTCWVSVLFSDIRGFTTLAEQMESQEVVAFLNEYLSEMTAAIRPWGGYINNFIGDAIVAVFGTPVNHVNNEWRAVAAALTMRERLEDLNRRRVARGEEPIRSGIGISTGEAVAGQIGSLERMLYTVIGDAVNVAARLETLTKDYPDYSILINEKTCFALQERDDIMLERVGPIKVKGRVQLVEVYAVTGWAKPQHQKRTSSLTVPDVLQT